ncbi:MAG: TetR/AcrR family transcriptional regulator [Micropruina sp.]|nr:MAG: TetR/AcrR family transcriptional regulator [Micropruina sp.]
MSTDETRARLLEAAATVLAEHGPSGISARSVAAEASVNQALIFYHFGSLAALVDQAVAARAATARARYRRSLAEARSFAELLAVGRELHRRESAVGNVRLMANLLAAAQSDPALAAGAASTMAGWVTDIEAAVSRLLRSSPLGGFVDARDLAGALSASFLGLELYQGVDPDNGRRALEALADLGALLEVIEGLGPMEQAIIRSRLRKARKHIRRPVRDA